jgi:hypothetical protein
MNESVVPEPSSQTTRVIGRVLPVVKFLEYGLGEGQKILSQADYAVLPSAILEKSKAAVASLECNGLPISG